MAAALAIPVIVVLTTSSGLPASRVSMSGGGAWLASPTQGAVTLIDGPSDQVVSAVRAPGALSGDALSVVQQGAAAYMVDGNQGTVSRVDGGTYEVSAPVKFSDGGAGAALQVYPGKSNSYVVDGQRRVASVVDPDTLKVRSRLALTAQPGPGQSVVDGAGRLWVVGDEGLAWFDRAGQHVRPDLGGAKARLVLVNDKAVLVDLARARVGELSDGGTVSSWSCLQLPAGTGDPQLLGSTGLGRVLAAVPATGTLVASGNGNDDCGLTVDIGKPGDTFGQLVETGGYVFVPNRSRGRTTVVELASRRVVADLDVVKPGAKLELIAKDGLVFYNDLGGDRAGVIHFDGGQWRTGKALLKYNRGRSGDAVLIPSAASGGRDKKPNQAKPDKPGQQKPDQQKPDQPDPGRSTPPDQPGDGELNPPPPNNPGGASDPGNPDPGNPDPGNPDPGNPDPGNPDPGNPDPGNPGDPGNPTDPATGTTTPPPPPPAAPVIQSLTWNPDVVVRETAATFTATVDNADGATWTWSIIDPATGAALQQQPTPVSATFNLPAGSPTDLQIKLEVVSSAGAATPVVRGFQTTSSHKPQIDSLTATPNPAGVGQSVTFHAVESAAADRARWAWTVNGPGGATGSPQMDPGVDLVKSFDQAGSYTVTLTVTYDGASDTRTVPFTVADNATLAGVTASPVDIPSGGSANVTVQLSGSFTAQTVTVTTASWLSASAGSITIPANGTGSVTVRNVGTAPVDGRNTGVLTFRLGNGNSVSYDATVNLAPRNAQGSCIRTLKGPQNIFVTVFSGSVADGNPAGVTATVQVGGGALITMQQIDASNGVASFTADRPVGLLDKNVDSFTVVFTDSGHLTTAVTVARGVCWP
ncbi:MAG: hypothetical protein V7637_2563 [Mycobacteriales bacterium]